MQRLRGACTATNPVVSMTVVQACQTVVSMTVTRRHWSRTTFGIQFYARNIQTVAVVSHSDDPAMVLKRTCNRSAGHEPAGCRRHVRSHMFSRSRTSRVCEAVFFCVQHGERGGVLGVDVADIVSKWRSSDRRRDFVERKWSCKN